MLYGMAVNIMTGAPKNIATYAKTIQCVFIKARAIVGTAGLTTKSLQRFQPASMAHMGATDGWRKQVSTQAGT